RLPVVAKVEIEPLAQTRVESLLADMTEGGMAHVVPEPDRLRQVLVQLQRPGHSPGDPGRLERVRHARAEVVAGGIDEHLGLALQAPERLRVENPVAVALEWRAHPTFVLLARAPARVIRTDGERGQPALLVLAHAGLERIRNSPSQFGHLLRHV